MTAGRKINTDNKEWGTPKKYIKAIYDFFGVPSLDPCSNKYSIVNADTEFILPQDGLKLAWDYKTIYVNPPYGIDKKRGTRIKDWFKKIVKERYDSEILLLVPVATNTSHWKEYVYPYATGISFLYDTRLKFLVNGEIGGNGAPMACAMIYYGKRPKKFKKVFSEYGSIWIL